MQKVGQKFGLLLAVSSVILVAGCVGGPFQSLFGQPGEVKEAPADVITVSDINVIPATVAPGETFTVSFKVINTGDFVVSDVGLLVYDWGLCKPTFTTAATKFESLGDLVPQQTEFKELEFTAPSASETGGLEASCPIRWKVNYTMASVSASTAQVINSVELQRLQRAGQSATFTPITNIGPGPVKISLAWGADMPVKNNSALSLFIQVLDKGSGTFPDITEPGKITLTVPTNFKMDTCGGYFNNTTVSQGFATNTDKLIAMVRKQSIQVRCGLTTPVDVAVSKTYTFGANMSYVYDLTAEQVVPITAR